VLTAAELADRWKISLAKAYKLADKLRALRVDGSVRFSLAVVEEYEQKQIGRPLEGVGA
jgi:hypothetical protein